jgi:uncharacterized protein (DUF983 family)
MLQYKERWYFNFVDYMVKKGSKLYSILNNRCPHCHEGDFFEGSFFKGSPKERCGVCSNKFSKEPGFYQGSYYVVYALEVAVFVTIWCSLRLFFKGVEFDTVLISVIVGIFITAPIAYPLSKIIWANMFFHYSKINKKSNLSK